MTDHAHGAAGRPSGRDALDRLDALDRIMHRVEAGLDSALDRTVAPGYTSLGLAVRRRLPSWPADPPKAALSGQNIIVTGATSGLGIATAQGLRALGAHVHLVVRDPEKATTVVAELESQLTPATDPAGAPAAALTIWRCDLADLTSVAEFTREFLASDTPLDGIVHNAGVLPSQRETSAQEHELTMAVHVLGPVAMTEQLLPALRAHQARVILVTSGGMYTQPLPVHDLDYRVGRYSGTVAYARSKRAQVELLPILQRRWAEADVCVYATHPGWAATPGVTQSLPAFEALTRPLLRNAAAGADTTVWLMATQPRPVGGGLWHDRRPRPTTLWSRHRAIGAERDLLWNWVAHCCDLQPTGVAESD